MFLKVQGFVVQSKSFRFLWFKKLEPILWCKFIKYTYYSILILLINISGFTLLILPAV